MTDLKPGDRVIYIGQNHNPSLVGKTGIVIGQIDGIGFRVQFDDRPYPYGARAENLIRAPEEVDTDALFTEIFGSGGE